jgi:hypothetical protein
VTEIKIKNIRDVTTGGSTMEFETKRQRNNYFRFVNTIVNDGPAA